MTTDEKISKIYDHVTDMKVELAKSIVHQENHAKMLHSQDSKITILEATHNENKGKKMVLTVAISSVISAVTAWVIKHF